MVRTLFSLAVAGVAGLWLCGPVQAAQAGGPLSMSLVRLSPSGKLYAFLADAGGAKRVVVATADNKVLLSIPASATQAMQDIEWAGEGHLLITNDTSVPLDPQYFEQHRDDVASVTAVNLDTHAAINVFVSPSQQRVVSAVIGQYGTARIGGHWYGYFGAYPYDTSSLGSVVRHDADFKAIASFEFYPDLYRVDLDTGALSVAAYGEPGAYGWLVTPDGQVVANAVFDQKSKTWSLHRGARGGATLLSGGGSDQGPVLVSLGPAPDTVVAKLQDKSGARLVELPLSPGAGAARPAVEDSALSVLVDRATDRWIGTADDNGQLDATAEASPAAAKIKAAFAPFDGEKPRLVSASADFNTMVVWTPAQGADGTYWRVDIGQQSAVPIGSGPTPKPAGAAARITFKADLAMRWQGEQMISAPVPSRGSKQGF